MTEREKKKDRTLLVYIPLFVIVVLCCCWLTLWSCMHQASPLLLTYQECICSIIKWQKQSDPRELHMF